MEKIKNIKNYQGKAKIMVNQLAHVKLQGAAGEYKHTLVEASYTTDIRRILNDNGYQDFKIITWKLITVDGLLIEDKSINEIIYEFNK